MNSKSVSLVYICPGNYSLHDGIFQKVNKQIDFWKTQGIESHLVTFNDVRFSFFWKILRRLPIPMIKSLSTYMVYSKIINKIIKKNNIKVIYTRHCLIPFFISKKPKLILEVNGDILKENKKSSFLHQFFIKKSIEFYNKQASGVALVSKSLTNTFESVKYKQTIPNGILANQEAVNKNALSRIENLPSLKKNNALVFLASKNRPYYAVESIVDIFKKLKNSKELHIIGNISLPHISDSNIFFWGPQKNQNLKKILSHCLVAIGSINLKNYLSGEASPLKVRTYLENAIPVFTAHNDSDFDNKSLFFKSYDFSQDDIEHFAAKLDNFISQISQEENYLTNYSNNVSHACVEQRELTRANFIFQVYEDEA